MLLACGDDDAPGRTTAGAAPAVSLTVRYDDGADHRSSGRLTCRAGRARATGALRRRGTAARLCRHARRSRTLLTRRPDPGRICTEIYGGPQTARVTGSIGGRRVDRRFSRTDGCEIADWDRAVPLLPRTRGAAPPP